MSESQPIEVSIERAQLVGKKVEELLNIFKDDQLNLNEVFACMGTAVASMLVTATAFVREEGLSRDNVLVAANQFHESTVKVVDTILNNLASGALALATNETDSQD